MRSRLPGATSRRGKEQGVANMGGLGGGMQESDTRLPSHTSRTLSVPFLATPKTRPPPFTTRLSTTLRDLSCKATNLTYSNLSSPFTEAKCSRPGRGRRKKFLAINDDRTTLGIQELDGINQTRAREQITFCSNDLRRRP